MTSQTKARSAITVTRQRGRALILLAFAIAAFCPGRLLRADTFTFTTLSGPDGSGAFAEGINDAGDIVGDYSTSDGTSGFLYNGTTWTTLYDPSAGAGNLTNALSISSNGLIAGYYFDGTEDHGFLFNGSTYQTLNDPNATGGIIAEGVNASGEVVGEFIENNVSFGF